MLVCCSIVSRQINELGGVVVGMTILLNVFVAGY